MEAKKFIANFIQPADRKPKKKVVVTEAINVKRRLEKEEMARLGIKSKKAYRKLRKKLRRAK